MIKFKYGYAIIILSSTISALTFAADCPDRFESTKLDYLGRNADGSKAYFITMSNRADSFRLEAPGVADIDRWQSSGPSVHISESNVVLDDLNGTHKLDRLNTDGSFNCFLHSRNQKAPILPPTWRPPTLPERPVGVKPENPDLPIVIRPEIPELPVVTRPELPDRPIVEPPNPLPPHVVSLNGLLYQLTTAQVVQYCPSIQFDATGQISDESIRDCKALIDTLNQVALTPGRDLLATSLWNSWADVQYIRSNNRRGLSPIEGSGVTMSIGADRAIEPDLALGFMLSLSNQDSDSFSGRIQSDSDSLMVGPYMAYGLSPHWSVFGSAMLGQVQRDYRLLSLSGKSSPMQYSLNLNLEGEYALDPHSVVRPKLGISYIYERGENYQLQGRLLGKTLAIHIDGHSHDSGQIQASAEWNRKIMTKDGQLFVPYLEGGVLYNYLNQDNNQDPRWKGMARAGVRTVAGQSWQIDTSVSYQSIGISDIKIWDFSLFVSHPF
ncbi:autotransporter outer membrane beta-barrel domain-containing protein [Chitinibacter bivalviorum]|uniref:Autotransporter outer membrane beta-barrel domain-containing protein n=1 Tax=Chitinibacter bivalviorum TaxID=2739434 RepID=A0A7H9BKD9_9NEIS|nr:autotransporter outer membrane beta-barrel domain-containing protein [Chitinibacter bivalviorum]QLG89033.1 autotransporter outer membrane beta-barrel domain-containing protein [Chitinibacter bivalviorum]